MNRMRPVVSLSTLLLMGIWLCPLLVASAMAQERVRAKIGLQLRAGERLVAAKSTERVKTGDAVRVYVLPEDDAYIYVVHNDGSTITLLNARDAATKVAKGTQVTLPSAEKFYEIDGASPHEALTVLCSPTALREVLTVGSGAKVSPEQWLAVERKLMDASKIDLGQQADKPFQIAGNVRSLGADPFAQALPISSGKAFVVKKYDLHVQK